MKRERHERSLKEDRKYIIYAAPSPSQNFQQNLPDNHSDRIQFQSLTDHLKEHFNQLIAQQYGVKYDKELRVWG